VYQGDGRQEAHRHHVPALALGPAVEQFVLWFPK
jgi:hypothetical protein